jgi:hypothetical protein
MAALKKLQEQEQMVAHLNKLRQLNENTIVFPGGSSEEQARKLAQGAEKEQGGPLQVAPSVKQEISFLLVSHEAVAMTPSPPEPVGGESTERKGGFPRDAPHQPPERDNPLPRRLLRPLRHSQRRAALALASRRLLALPAHLNTQV